MSCMNSEKTVLIVNFCEGNDLTVKEELSHEPEHSMSTALGSDEQDSDPWPYLREYFKFIERKENNVIYQCLTCRPTIKMLSANKRSQFNLKKHFKCTHASQVSQFEQDIRNAAMLVRKRACVLDVQHRTRKWLNQTSIKESLNSSKFLQKNVEKKVYNNKRPCEYVDSEISSMKQKEALPLDDFANAADVVVKEEPIFLIQQEQSLTTESANTGQDSDPWPYLKKYFKFVRTKGNNVIYQCLTCRPNIKMLSTNRRSKHNLKKHFRSVHSNKALEFEEDIINAAKLKRKQACTPEIANLPPKLCKRSTKNDSLSTSEVSQRKRQKKAHCVDERSDTNANETAPINYCSNSGHLTVKEELVPLVEQSTTTGLGSEEQVSDPWPYLKKYFRFVQMKGNNVIYQCLTCSPTIKMLSTNRWSQSNLKKHFKSAHSNKVSKFEHDITNAAKPRRKRTCTPKVDYQSQHLRRRSTINGSLASSKFSQINFENKLVNFFIANTLPLEMVESTSFQELVKACTPKAKLFTRRSLARLIEKKFMEKREELREITQKVSTVAKTADTIASKVRWSSGDDDACGLRLHPE